MTPLEEALAKNSYPGRGIVVGRSADCRFAVLIYFIMGRSVNSRNRVFVPVGDGIRTQAHDPAFLSDPSLVIYAPLRTLGAHTIVTNGDQTDTIHQRLAAGGTFEAALRTRAFEPDAPHFTPRISALVTLGGGGFCYRMSLLKSAEGDPAACNRFFYEYDTPLKGRGHFLHTYLGDGDPLPSFAGEPTPVALRGDIDSLSQAAWASLDPGNRVSLFVRFLRLCDGAFETRIINKHAAGDR